MSAFRIKKRRNNKRNHPQSAPAAEQQHPTPTTRPEPSHSDNFDFNAALRRYEDRCYGLDGYPCDEEEEEAANNELMEALRKKHGMAPSLTHFAPPSAGPTASAPLQPPPPPTPTNPPAPRDIPSANSPLTPATTPALGHSTGPRTPEGKARASLNAFLHGLTMAPGRTMSFLPHEDSDAHTQLNVQFNQQFVPITDAERQIVREIVDLLWLARRARDFQSYALESGDDHKLALYLRYETAHLRAHNAAIKTLLTLQKDRRHRDQHHEEWGEPARPVDFTLLSTPTKSTAPPQPLTTTTTSASDTSFRNPSVQPDATASILPETAPALTRKEQNLAA